MLTDPLTKDMDISHRVATLQRGWWSIEYVAGIMKSTIKAQQRAALKAKKKLLLDNDNVPALLNC